MPNASVALPAVYAGDALPAESPVVVYAVGRARVENDLGSVLMGTPVWDHAAFREFVISRAKRLEIADSTASLARETGIGHGLFSKWFRGQERPSPASLQKLANRIALPGEPPQGKTYVNLMVLAGHLKQQGSGLTAPPAPEPVVERHPLVRELDRLLSDGSKLSGEERDVLAGLVDRVLAGWRPQRNGRKRSA